MKLLMRASRWVPGRQSETLYHKLCLFSLKLGRWGFDAYILRYPTNTVLNMHRDVVEDGEHYRCNIKLWGKCHFTCIGKEIFSLGEFIHIFRPDKQLHGLIVFKRTFKLSLGIAKFDT